MSRYIAITDIHGEAEKLDELLNKIETKSDDIFVFMGDYIDRGPDSKGVVDRVLEQSNTHNCIYLMGSHEYAIMHRNDEYYNFLFMNYGGPETIKSYGSFDNIFKSHGDFYRNLKMYHLTDKFLFVHAGINPEYSLENQPETDLVYIRWNFINSKIDLPQRVIFGHTDLKEPYVDEYKIGIDLGCGKYPDAKLCGLILNEDGSHNFVMTD